MKNPSPAWLWVAVPVVPAFSFLVAMPYAVLDLPAFLSHAGYELYHYAAEGHGAVSTEAGWGHFTLQLSRLASHLGIVATVVALIGLVVLIRKRWGFLTLVFPLIYLITMAGTRVSFHRNLVVVYPFAAIALGAGVMVLLRQLGRVEKNYPWCKRYALGVAGVVLAVWYSYLVVTAFVDGWHDWTGRETRSRTIDVVNSLAEEFSNDGRGDEFRVGIAEELRIHSLDLDRLEMAYSLEPHLNLVCSATEYDVLVTANHYLGLWGHNRQAKEKAFILNAAKLQDVERITVSNAQNTSSPTRLDALSENPTVVIHLPRRQVERLPPVCHEAQRRENGRLQERSPNV